MNTPPILNASEPVTPLYAGPAVLFNPISERQVEQDVEVTFRWLRTPRVVFTYHRGSGLKALCRGLAEPEWTVKSVDGPWSLNPDAMPIANGDEGRSTPWAINGLVLGEDGQVDEVVVQVLNLTVALDRIRSEPFLVELGPWAVQVEEVGDRAEKRRYLQDTGLYDVTHLLRIRRHDGAPFEWRDADEAHGRLWLALSAMNGRLVGLALPVGYRDGHVVWRRCEVTMCDRGSGTAPTWADGHRFDQQLQEFAPLFYNATADMYMHRVLRRVIRVIVDANNLQPIDTSLPLAQSGLELLAWVQLGKSDSYAAGRIRLLLEWAGISPEIPEEFTDLLQARPTGVAQKEYDGPRALTLVRRNIVHPQRTEEWPTSDVMLQAWRLALSYLELVLLRIVGYEGVYAPRLLLGARWIGTVQPVPWSGQ